MSPVDEDSIVGSILCASQGVGDTGGTAFEHLNGTKAMDEDWSYCSSFCACQSRRVKER